jgi:hypothetical protein
LTAAFQQPRTLLSSTTLQELSEPIPALGGAP